MKLKLYILLFLSTSLFAQKVETSVDKTKNKIGAQFTLTLKTNVKSTSTVLFPKAKNFGALEVLESYPIDTIKENDRYQLIKKYGLTQFDSGKYLIPRIPVIIDKVSVLSDSIKVEVFNVSVDTLKQKMYDIKPIILVEKPAGDWWKYILGVILILGIAALGYFLWLKYRIVKEKPIVYNSPIEKATCLLQLLEKKELLQNGEVKAYYSELTDIARDYIEEAINIPAKESTTSELILALRAASNKKKMKLSKETLLSLEKVLKQADLVKFAQVKPLDFEIENDRDNIEKTIVILDKSIPEIDNENIRKTELLQQEIKRKKELRKKKTTVSSIIVGILAFIITYTLTTKGIEYVFNGFSGYSTKELLNGNWVKSEYGNPTIKIETPEVLTRLDVTKTLPQTTKELIKNIQVFGFGSFLGGFNVYVSNTQFKKETELDLTQALNGTIQTLQSQGCKNVISKQEEFATQSGTKGVKGFGTFMFNDKKMQFEMILFSQGGGLQQIMTSYKEGDENANKISERILNSVEFQINK
jgi:hypothetical protein